MKNFQKKILDSTDSVNIHSRCAACYSHECASHLWRAVALGTPPHCAIRFHGLPLPPSAPAPTGWSAPHHWSELRPKVRRADPRATGGPPAMATAIAAPSWQAPSWGENELCRLWAQPPPLQASSRVPTPSVPALQPRGHADADANAACHSPRRRHRRRPPCSATPWPKLGVAWRRHSRSLASRGTTGAGSELLPARCGDAGTNGMATGWRREAGRAATAWPRVATAPSSLAKHGEEGRQLLPGRHCKDLYLFRVLYAKIRDLFKACLAQLSFIS
jgi:hypothetical protein